MAKRPPLVREHLHARIRTILHTPKHAHPMSSGSVEVKNGSQVAGVQKGGATREERIVISEQTHRCRSIPSHHTRHHRGLQAAQQPPPTGSTGKGTLAGHSPSCFFFSLPHKVVDSMLREFKEVNARNSVYILGGIGGLRGGFVHRTVPYP
jgi:hypothetical protein